MAKFQLFYTITQPHLSPHKKISDNFSIVQDGIKAEKHLYPVEDWQQIQKAIFAYFAQLDLNALEVGHQTKQLRVTMPRRSALRKLAVKKNFERLKDEHISANGIGDSQEVILKLPKVHGKHSKRMRAIMSKRIKEAKKEIKEQQPFYYK